MDASPWAPPLRAHSLLALFDQEPQGGRPSFLDPAVLVTG
jgi:hypothetical protein